MDVYVGKQIFRPDESLPLCRETGISTTWSLGSRLAHKSGLCGFVPIIPWGFVSASDHHHTFVEEGNCSQKQKHPMSGSALEMFAVDPSRRRGEWCCRVSPGGLPETQLQWSAGNPANRPQQLVCTSLSNCVISPLKAAGTMSGGLVLHVKGLVLLLEKSVHFCRMK